MADRLWKIKRRKRSLDLLGGADAAGLIHLQFVIIFHGGDRIAVGLDHAAVGIDRRLNKRAPKTPLADAEFLDMPLLRSDVIIADDDARKVLVLLVGSHEKPTRAVHLNRAARMIGAKALRQHARPHADQYSIAGFYQIDLPLSFLHLAAGEGPGNGGGLLLGDIAIPHILSGLDDPHPLLADEGGVKPARREIHQQTSRTIQAVVLVFLDGRAVEQAYAVEHFPENISRHRLARIIPGGILYGGVAAGRGEREQVVKILIGLHNGLLRKPALALSGVSDLSLIHISEPTRQAEISYA